MSGVGAVTSPVSYSSYLKLDDLLQLQQPLTPAAAEELLFIVVHQAHELHFKLILHELHETVDALEGDWVRASRLLRRVIVAEELLIAHLGLLETMTAEEFLQFREPLTPASGFQSEQYRAIAAYSRKEVWGAFARALRGLTGSSASTGDLLYQLATGPRDRDRDLLRDVADGLIGHDERFLEWKFRHSMMVAREIGGRPGTGGSPGLAYLTSTLADRLFPELWESRSRL